MVVPPCTPDAVGLPRNHAPILRLQRCNHLNTRINNTIALKTNLMTLSILSFVLNTCIDAHSKIRANATGNAT